MGNFYVNFTTRGPDQAAIAKSLRSAKRSAMIGPSLAALTVFYDEQSDTQDDSEISVVGEATSRDLNAPVLAVLNHDDDILAYWLFDKGRLVDEYNSCPGYFTDGNDTPSGGDAAKLCSAFAVPDKGKAVNEVLRQKDYTFAFERHQALVELLTFPSLYCFTGYQYVAGGEVPEGVSSGDFVRVD
jgi:hypothetical protein